MVDFFKSFERMVATFPDNDPSEGYSFVDSRWGVNRNNLPNTQPLPKSENEATYFLFRKIWNPGCMWALRSQALADLVFAYACQLGFETMTDILKFAANRIGLSPSISEHIAEDFTHLLNVCPSQVQIHRQVMLAIGIYFHNSYQGEATASYCKDMERLFSFNDYMED